MNKRCPDCGVKVPVSAEVCPNCGYNFAENADENFPKDVGILGIQPGGPQKQDTKPAVKAIQPKSAAPKTQSKTELQAKNKPVKSGVQPSLAKAKTQTSAVKPKKTKKPVVATAPTEPVAASEPVKKPKPRPLPTQPPAKSQPQSRFLHEHHSILSSKDKAKQRREHRQTSRPRYHLFHVILGVIAAMIVVFAAFLALGTHFYSKDKQVTQITQCLIKPDAAVKGRVVTPDPNVKITPAAVKPLQQYYEQHPAALNHLQAKLKGTQSGSVRLVQTGEYLALFPKYALQLPTYQLTVLTNQNKSNLAINGQIKGEMTERQGRYYQLKAAHQLPGLYRVTVQRGKQLKSKAVNLWSNKQLILLTKAVAKKKKAKTKARGKGRSIAAVMQRAFATPQPSDFVRGAANSSYQVLNTMHHSSRSRNYRVSVKVNSVAQVLHRRCQVNYQVIYYFASGRVRQQVMRYQGGVLIKENGQYKLQTMGSGHFVREN